MFCVKNISLTTQCIKYMLILLDILFMMSGIIMVCMGVGVDNYNADYGAILDEKYGQVATLMICIGVVILNIGVFGFCGAAKESYCMIIAYSSLMVVVFVMELAAGVTGLVMYNATAEVFPIKMNESMYDYQIKLDTARVWDKIQHEMECCGVDGPEDWVNLWHPLNRTESRNSSIEINSLPLSCCKPGVIGKCLHTKDNTTKLQFYEDGCSQKVTSDAQKSTLKIGVFTLNLCSLQVVHIWFTSELASAMKRNFSG